MTGLDDSFPYRLSETLIWRDMDAFQHINNAVYFRYFEDLRMVFFHEAGIIEYMERHRIGPILASTRCDFRAPLTFPGRIQIGGAVEDVKPKRFTMKYAVFSESPAVLAAEGESLLVYYDYDRGRSCEIPEPVLDALRAIERT